MEERRYLIHTGGVLSVYYHAPEKKVKTEFILKIGDRSHLKFYQRKVNSNQAGYVSGRYIGILKKN